MSFESLIAFILLLILSPLMIIVILLIKLETRGPSIFWSKRYGLNKKIFLMPKFRSMILNTPIASSQTLKKPNQYITFFGKIIRKTSFDELPQLWSIITGEMSFIGPRPLLSTEKKLLSEREKFRGNQIKPGITGWAQVNGRDQNSPQMKIKHEKYYIENNSIYLKCKIILKTFILLLQFKNIRH